MDAAEGKGALLAAVGAIESDSSGGQRCATDSDYRLIVVPAASGAGNATGQAGAAKGECRRNETARGGTRCTQATTAIAG